MGRLNYARIHSLAHDVELNGKISFQIVYFALCRGETFVHMLLYIRRLFSSVCHGIQYGCDINVVCQ